LHIHFKKIENPSISVSQSRTMLSKFLKM
jgi:hypothetical protein